MSTLTRQNTLFVAEDWVRIYEAMENVDFRAYDFDNLVQALMGYLRNTYPEQFNDWVASSEFVTKIEILAWLSQNIAFRVDLNTRENFLATAERRDSLIRLAQNIGYKVSRVRSAHGFLKLESLRTTQEIYDSNGTNLSNRTIVWNNAADEDWFERTITILNNAFTNRTQFGNPISRYNGSGLRIDQYIIDSGTPTNGSYRFNARVNNQSLPFDICNSWLDQTTGLAREIAPNPTNAFNILYQMDGKGFSSANTGFMVPLKQGNMAYQDELFDVAQPIRVVTLSATNINNDDFFVQRIDDSGNVLEDWTQVDTIFGEGVSFNTIAGTIQTIYEVDTLVNDQVRIRFGDGTFGKIPVGRFRFWYRTANPTPTQIIPSSIKNQSITMPYMSGGNIYQLTLTFSLQTAISNGSRSETMDDIRTRAGKVFYTQNRMVNAQDYNNFYLKDNTIQKVKTVNRMFTGQSRYSKLSDPTGMYENIKHTSDDGRIYKDETRAVNDYTANTDLLTTDDLINLHIKPLIRKADKRTLFYNQYIGITFPDGYVWNETSVVNGISRGTINFGGTPQAVGAQSTGIGRYIDADSIIRLENAQGDIVSVERVIDNGNIPNGVWLKNKLSSGSKLFSVSPLIRNRFTTDEFDRIKEQLEQRTTFALSWNQNDMSWTIIHRDNIDVNSSFSLINQGNQSGNNKDASWLIYIRYIKNGSSEYWRITDRGEGIFFESAREVKFLYNNAGTVIDPTTGKTVRDTITLLKYNETRNSLLRRGISAPTTIPNVGVYAFVGDGNTRDYQTTEIPMDADHTVVLLNGLLQVLDYDYTIVPDSGGYIIRFDEIVSLGDEIVIYYAENYHRGDIVVRQFIGDGITEEYDLGITVVNPTNIIAFINGIVQNSSLDFGISTAPNGNATIVFNEVLPSDDVVTAYVIGGIDNTLYTKVNYDGDGVTQDFAIPVPSRTNKDVLISIDGVIQDSNTYNITSNITFSSVRFNLPPGDGTKIRTITTVNDAQIQTRNITLTGDGGTDYDLTIDIRNGNGLIITLDGVHQEPPGSINPAWQVLNTNTIRFNEPVAVGMGIQVYQIVGATGIVIGTNTLPDGSNDGKSTPTFMDADIPFVPVDTIRYLDGYTNPSGLIVAPLDADGDGVYDQPMIFNSIVIADGKSDLVLWRMTAKYGYSVFEPINDNTVPKGTYSNNPVEGIIPDAPLMDGQSNGDIHYNVALNLWLVADEDSGKWLVAVDQTAFKYKIGRDNMSFMWTHYSTESRRIDPAMSNIMNVYILTAGYDAAYRAWIDTNGSDDTTPIGETSEQLRIQYSNFDQFKPISDSIIYYPAKYKPLFGNQAVPELRAIFKLVQTPGSKMTETDLRLRVQTAITAYFDVNRWDFGEKFYFTELVAFVHAQLAPDLQSMIIVPRDTNQAFGRMFQVRSEPDELFISAATVDDIVVVPYFTDAEMRIGASL